MTLVSNHTVTGSTTLGYGSARGTNGLTVRQRDSYSLDEPGIALKSALQMASHPLPEPEEERDRDLPKKTPSASMAQILWRLSAGVPWIRFNIRERQKTVFLETPVRSPTSRSLARFSLYVGCKCGMVHDAPWWCCAPLLELSDLGTCQVDDLPGEPKTGLGDGGASISELDHPVLGEVPRHDTELQI